MFSQALRADAVVIGAGAAGMLAAAAAARRGLDVVVLEKNDYPGRKLRITGKGRCNVTNACDVREFLTNIPVNGRFLYSALNKFPPQSAMAYFEALGVPLKVERGNRVFPISDKAADISSALERDARGSGARFMKARAQNVLEQAGAVIGVETDIGPIACGGVIICTGGLSYPATGSTGDGYAFARKLGHTVIAPKASLVPLVCRGTLCRDLMGLSLRNVRIDVFEDEKKLFSDFGELLFTHFGMSGPLILSASAHMRHFGEKDYSVAIDLKPALDEKTLDRRLLSDFEKHKNNDFINALGELLPRKMIPVIVACSEIPPHTKVHSITKEQRQDFLRLLKAFPVAVTGTRPVEEAIVTTGGVDVREINPRTMASKRVDGLYFAGEVLDVDGYTGGFNLQIAWSTAYLAGNSVCLERSN